MKKLIRRLRRIFRGIHCPRCEKYSHHHLEQLFCVEQGRHFRHVCHKCSVEITTKAKQLESR